MATRQRFVAGRTAVSRVPLRLHTTAPEMTLLLTSWQEMDAAVAEAIAVTGRRGGRCASARKLIAPRLGRYHRAHPDVVLDIVIDDGLIDIVAGRFRRRDFPWSDGTLGRMGITDYHIGHRPGVLRLWDKQTQRRFSWRNPGDVGTATATADATNDA